MYDMISTKKDTLKERYIDGAILTGKYGFPQLPLISADTSGLKSVPFNLARKEKRPKESVCHCFIDDNRFSNLWNEPIKHIEYLQNFRYFIPPDFSFYSDMPLVLQIYQVYRTRAMHYYLSCFGINCIPVVGWSDESSFGFCFDGLPEHSTLAVSTNGCFSKNGKECYRRGFSEMCRRLKPRNVIVVGRQIEVAEDVEIQYLDSFGQEMTKRIGEKDGKSQRKETEL